MAAMAAASQALGLAASFASLAVQEPHRKLGSVASVSSCGGALRCAALKVGVPVGLGRRSSVVVRAAMADAAELESPEMEERRTLEAWVKQQLPGGFAAARLIGTGRRKTAVARVVLVEGSGKIVINNRTAQDYLQGNPLWLQAVKYPLASLGYETKYDIIVRAEGGGLSAQAQAILLGVARALIVANQANRDPLKKQGLLTRDSRIVERKKYGLKKARKAPQYSKR
ncbi:hypothetical protein KC19_7G042300 [Ceratodon purpureus]|uniref:Small ribosomal subunit protein uS9c n=1 Tax=Ceratodon purpureus TaxID=3225 RepID=A0A8T0H6Z7_CERPU|nr:hypothetical protein KC19_7G042300 [Ceratodon purpureus]